MSIFTKDETLEVINEKARLRGMSYGQYVHARYHGQFTEDALKNIKLKHEHRVAYMKNHKRR